MKWKFRRIKWLLMSILVFLVGARIALPYVVLHYVTQQINKIPGYHVSIADLDIHLIQGRYTIKNLELWKTAAQVPAPFFKSDIINFSVQWKALFKGKFVGEIEAYRASLNFVTEPDAENEQLTINQRWLEIVKSLFPVNINQVTVHKGAIFLKSFHGDPPFSIYLKEIELQIKNMQNAQRLKKGLLSSIGLTAKGMDDVDVKVTGKLDPFARTPTFYLTASVQTLPLTEINSFLKHYVDVKAKTGTFSLFLEIAAANGKITGYAKPFLKNFTVAAEKEASPLHQLYTGAVAVAANILENRQQKSVATQINFTGKVDDPDISTLSIILYFLQHGFIQALLPQIDRKVSMEDVQYPAEKFIDFRI